MLVPQPIIPHERIGRYEVLRKIATGGMAELFLAKQVGMEGFEKVVAIKRILAHLAYDEEFINMFRDEARIVAKLSHPAIVQIYDLGKSGDTYFIAMEYIPGRNLSSIAKKARSLGQRISPEYIARCMALACEGLYYAHTRQDVDGKPLQIVHRDVSPQNIILAFSGGVKLVDFGIAKAATKIAQTRVGVLKGKYAYMSPEQIKGDLVDARSDLFAAGIVLYELLCGRRPFEKDNSIQTLKAIVQEPHLDCRELNADIPDGLAAIIDRALSKNPRDRYGDAQELQIALDDFVSGTKTRCNNIVISRWVTDLFSDELSRERGGTVVFQGVGEVILPDFDGRVDDAPNAKPLLRVKSSPPARRHSSGLGLGLGIGIGSGIGVEAPVARARASSSILGPTTRPLAPLRPGPPEKTADSGPAIAVHRGLSTGGSAAIDGGWNDDRTALASESLGDAPPWDGDAIAWVDENRTPSLLNGDAPNAASQPVEDPWGDKTTTSELPFGSEIFPSSEIELSEAARARTEDPFDARTVSASSSRNASGEHRVDETSNTENAPDSDETVDAIECAEDAESADSVELESVDVAEAVDFEETDDSSRPTSALGAVGVQLAPSDEPIEFARRDDWAEAVVLGADEPEGSAAQWAGRGWSIASEGSEESTQMSMGNGYPPSSRSAAFPVVPVIPTPIHVTPQPRLVLGSTNVPPASLSLSEMLSNPPPSSGRSGGLSLLGGGTPRVRAIETVSHETRGTPLPVRPVREMPRALDEPSVPTSDELQVEPLPHRPRRTGVVAVVLAGIAVVLALALLAVLPEGGPELKIKTTPDGARIVIDGQAQPGETPITIGGLVPGRTYNIEVHHEGYAPMTKSVPIPRDKRFVSVHVQLERSAAEP